jgi:hypothetical protein
MRISLAILMLSQEKLLSKKMDQVMEYLNIMEDKILFPHILIPHALGIKITNRILKTLQQQNAFGTNNNTKKRNTRSSSSSGTTTQVNRRTSSTSTSTSTSTTTTTSTISTTTSNSSTTGTTISL